MSRRSKSRQVAVQMLYQIDLNPDLDSDAIRGMIADRISDQDLKSFAWSLFTGVMEHRNELDLGIEEITANWKLTRMAVTDRAVLRLGAYELRKTDTPVGVVIDEAIELAKKFGDAHSPTFVNGILDRLVPPGKRRRRDA